jgi:hypothetical protein
MHQLQRRHAEVSVSLRRPLAQDLGSFNVGWRNPRQRSPHVDALRSEGVALAAHYTYSFCSPTRSSFLSGRLPLHVNEGNPPGMRLRDGGVGGIDLRYAQQRMAGAGIVCTGQIGPPTTTTPR